MRPNKIKALWNEGKPAASAWLSIPDLYVAEMVSQAGFDAIVLARERGGGSGPEGGAAWLQAVRGGDSRRIVRVRWSEPA